MLFLNVSTVSSFLTLLLLIPVINLFKSLKTFLSSLLILTLFMSVLISSINLFVSLKSSFDFNYLSNTLSTILSCLGSGPSFSFKAPSSSFFIRIKIMVVKFHKPLFYALLSSREWLLGALQTCLKDGKTHFCSCI